MTQRSDDVSELVQRAEKLQPLLAAHAARTDTTRRPATEALAAITEAGLLKLGTPRRFGGYQSPLRTQVEVSAALGQGCGSTAWIVQNMNGSAVFAGMLPEKAQNEVWADSPDARVVAAMGPLTEVTRVEGGFRVSGKVGWLSGVDYADWAMVGFATPEYEQHPPGVVMGLVPVEPARIEDTWQVTGMRGTCTNTLHLEQVHVPDHRTMNVLGLLAGLSPTEFQDEVLYRGTQFSLTLAIILAGTQIGLARAAAELVRAKAPTRPISYTTYGSQAQSVGFQIQLGQAEVMIDSATRYLLDIAERIDDAGRQGRQLPLHRRLMLRAGLSWACTQLREAVGLLVDAHGTSSFAEANPLQRIWRDINTASRHAMLNAQVGFEAHGASALGAPTTIIPTA
ncbi:acyl-CoA dehydrogenase family protein [Nocardia sp. NPDC047038]|uniref:acyl-CoA dehydrogenase family protein n=1 Tax=Nocardia sp. NPDC047038 TaxID=3154338 RepID=UPI0033EE72B9